MAFSNAWVETDPDGSVITVSQLDNSDRLIKAAVRERLEGDPAAPDLTGLIEVGSFTSAPKPRKGAARVYVDTQANILVFGATKREDGRLAVASDTNKLYHVATAAVIAVITTPETHVHPASDITSGTLVVARGGTGVASPTSGNLLVGAGASAMTLLAPGAAGGFVRSDGSAWVRSAIAASDVALGTFADARIAQSNVTQHQASLVLDATQITTGVLAYARLPVGSGQWDVGTGGPPVWDLHSAITSAIFKITGGSNLWLSVDRTGVSGNDTAISVWDETAASAKRVSRGATDSGGAGFRLLRVAN